MGGSMLPSPRGVGGPSLTAGVLRARRASAEMSVGVVARAFADLVGGGLAGCEGGGRTMWGYDVDQG